MAGVDHAYQYSVEVKSRFSLFLDDNLNNEDPDILISKLQTKRTEKSKKEKVTSNVVQTAKPSEAAPDVEIKEDAVAKVHAAKSPKPTQPAPLNVVDEHTSEPKEQSTRVPPHVRGRGDGNFRGFRGRGRGFRAPMHDAQADANGDPRAPSLPFDSRGRGRGRGRFIRDRNSGYMDHRSFESQGAERGGSRPHFGPGDQYHENQRGGPRAHFAPEDQENQPIEVVNGGNEDVSEPHDVDAIANDGHGDPAVDKEEVEAEEEPKTYTLEEYKAMRSSAKPIVTIATKGGRKANDGKDVFANMIPHRKIDEVSDDEEEVVETEKAPEPEPAYEINVSFNDRFSSTRGARGGIPRGRGAPGFRGGGGGRSRGPPNARGGFRGDRGRGFTGKPAHEHQAPPVIYSDQDFPSLK